MGVTRRTYVRRNLQPPIHVRAGPTSTWEVLDMSEGGIGILSVEPLAEGKTIRLQIPLPGLGPNVKHSPLAEASCEIVWASGSGRAGMRFLDLSEDSRALLRRWVGRAESAGLSRGAAIAQPKTLLATPSQPVARVEHPWIILAGAILIGVLSGIWLALQQDGPKPRNLTPVKGGGQLPVQPGRSGPPKEQQVAAVPTIPKSNPPEDRAEAATAPTAPPSIRTIHFSQQPGRTRVVIELGNSTITRTGQLHNPERIYFDLRAGRRQKGVARQSEQRKFTETSDRLLSGVRIAPHRSGDVRVVLDLRRSCRFSYRLAHQPSRQIIVELRTPKPGAPVPE